MPVCGDLPGILRLVWFRFRPKSGSKLTKSFPTETRSLGSLGASTYTRGTYPVYTRGHLLYPGDPGMPGVRGQFPGSNFDRLITIVVGFEVFSLACVGSSG